MISLEQIKLLEQKVDIALKKILDLQSVNANLKLKNDDLETEIALLKEQAAISGQEEELIEKGILSVIDRLNFVEDTVRQTQTSVVENNVVEEESVEDETIVNFDEEIVEEEVSEEIENTVIEEQIDDFSDDIIEEEFDIEESFEEDVTPAQGQGMLNAAQNSAQLDIF